MRTLWLLIYVLATAAFPRYGFGQQPTDTRILAEFDIEKGGGSPILLPVRLSESTYQFALDTGATSSVYDLSLRPALGEPTGRAKGGDATGEVGTFERFQAPSASIAGLQLHRSRDVYCTDLRNLRQDRGNRVHGVIGMEALSHRILEIDFDCGKVRFVTSVLKDGMTEVPLKWRQYRKFRAGPFTEARLGTAAGGNVEVRVDTGWTGFESGGITEKLFSKLNISGEMDVVDSTTLVTAVTGSSTRVRFGRIASFTIGPFEHKDALFVESKEPVVGLTYLSRFKVAFDFPRSVMYLGKGEQYDRRDMYDLSGLDLRRPANSVIIRAIEPRSEADVAGLKKNDVITRVDDTVCDEVSINELRRLFCIPGEHRVLVIRDGKELEFGLRLKE